MVRRVDLRPERAAAAAALALPPQRLPPLGEVQRALGTPRRAPRLGAPPPRCRPRLVPRRPPRRARRHTRHRARLALALALVETRARTVAAVAAFAATPPALALALTLTLGLALALLLTRTPLPALAPTLALVLALALALALGLALIAARSPVTLGDRALPRRDRARAQQRSLIGRVGEAEVDAAEARLVRTQREGRVFMYAQEAVLVALLLA